MTQDKAPPLSEQLKPYQPNPPLTAEQFAVKCHDEMRRIGKQFADDGEDAQSVYDSAIVNCLTRWIRTVVVERDATIAEGSKIIMRQRTWISDLQSGLYVNCVYCGHRYGKNGEVPTTMADVLKQHIEQCPEHPLSKLRADYNALQAEFEKMEARLEALQATPTHKL